MLRGTPQDAGERGRVPDRLDGGILSLTPLEPDQSLGMVSLDDLDLLHFHLDIMEFLVERRETRIHARTGTPGEEDSWGGGGGVCRSLDSGREGSHEKVSVGAVVANRRNGSSGAVELKLLSRPSLPCALDSALVSASRSPYLLLSRPRTSRIRTRWPSAPTSHAKDRRVFLRCYLLVCLGCSRTL